MSATALILVNKILLKMRLTYRATTLVNAEGYAPLILHALNEIKDELLSEYDWRVAKKQGTITLDNGVEFYALASDFLRFLNTTQPLYYGIDNGEDEINKISIRIDGTWVEHTAVNTSDGTPYIARLFGSDQVTGYERIQVRNIPDAVMDGTTVYYDYIRQIPAMEADADKVPFNDILMITGAFTKLMDDKGRATQKMLLEWEQLKATAKRQDGAGRQRKLKYRDIG